MNLDFNHFYFYFFQFISLHFCDFVCSVLIFNDTFIWAIQESSFILVAHISLQYQSNYFSFLSLFFCTFLTYTSGIAVWIITNNNQRRIDAIKKLKKLFAEDQCLAQINKQPSIQMVIMKKRLKVSNFSMMKKAFI